MYAAEIALFWAALPGYIAGSVAYMYYLAFRKSFVLTLAAVVVPTAWVLHLSSLVTRGVAAGHFPFSGAYEFLSVFAWGVVGIYLFIQRSSHLPALGAFVLPLAWLLMGVAWVNYGSPVELRPELRSSWFVVHVTVAFLAYAAFAVAFGVAVMYLIQERNLKRKVTGSLLRRLPPLEVLDHLSYRSVIFGFPLLTLALISGMIWAEQAWGTYWIWDPKLTAAVVTWVIFAAYLHAHVIAGWQGRRAAWLAAIGFVAALLTFGLSFIVGPHGTEGLRTIIGG